jgi:hypothetical protein
MNKDNYTQTQRFVTKLEFDTINIYVEGVKKNPKQLLT